MTYKQRIVLSDNYQQNHTRKNCKEFVKYTSLFIANFPTDFFSCDIQATALLKIKLLQRWSQKYCNKIWKTNLFCVILVRIFPHSDQNNSKYRHFLRSENISELFTTNLILIKKICLVSKKDFCLIHFIRYFSFQFKT